MVELGKGLCHAFVHYPQHDCDHDDLQVTCDCGYIKSFDDESKAHEDADAHNQLPGHYEDD